MVSLFSKIFHFLQSSNNIDSKKHEFKMHYVFLQWRIVVNAKHIVSSKDSCIINASSLKISFCFWTYVGTNGVWQISSLFHSFPTITLHIYMKKVGFADIDVANESFGFKELWNTSLQKCFSVYIFCVLIDIYSLPIKPNQILT